MFKIGDRYYNIKIIRKNNRNIYLRVKGDVLEITCPRRVTKEEILKFLSEKSSWIVKVANKDEIKKDTSKLVIGDSIYYLGKKYDLLVLNGKSDLKIVDDKVIIHCKDGTIGNAINVFYKESKKTLLDLIHKIEPKYLSILEDYGYDLEPEYKVRVLRSMWGVNYPKKNQITINERLIHFDPICLEAILWHELLHFVIPNHSKRFHEVLEYHMKDYKKIVKSIY